MGKPLRPLVHRMRACLEYYKVPSPIAWNTGLLEHTEGSVYRG
jgi:hypothetical protein